ncbi:cyclin [Phycomyces blakesleeanus]
MSMLTTASVRTHNPEALLSFTTNVAASILLCSQTNQHAKSHWAQRKLPNLKSFVDTLFKKMQLPLAVCLVDLIYLSRLKCQLPDHARGNIDTPHRLFLASILTASKFMNDPENALTNQQLSEMTDGLYTVSDINQMERTFLALVHFRLFVDDKDLRSFLVKHGELLKVDLVEEQSSYY